MKKESNTKNVEFIGRVITPENRNRIKGELQEYFINNISTDERYSQLSNDGIITAANTYATHFIQREMKHFKAYLKGRAFYEYKGARYPVLTDSTSPTFFSDMSELYNLDLTNTEEFVPFTNEEE